jgi:hypothetical protein
MQMPSGFAQHNVDVLKLRGGFRDLVGWHKRKILNGHASRIIEIEMYECAA